MVMRPQPAPTVRRWMEVHGDRIMLIAEAYAEGPITAEDIFQETFVKAWKKRPELDSDGDVGAWLYRVALNIGRETLRRRQRRESLMARWISRPRPSPPHTIEEELDRLALWRAIHSLPRRQRDVLLLRLVRDVGTHDIASQLGIREATVRATLRDALGSLRVKLETEQALAVPTPQETPTVLGVHP